MESKTQRSRPRPRYQKIKSEAKAKDTILQAASKKKVIGLETEVKIKFSLVIVLFHEPKNSSVLEPRTGHFRGLADFEANTKDLSFEAKDFKICPRGQGRP